MAKPKVNVEALMDVKASGLHSWGGPTTAGLSGGGGGVIMPGDGRSWQQVEYARLLALKALRPEWWEAKRRLSAYHVSALDVDIAGFQSVSMSAKLAMQRERNYEQQLAMEERSLLQRINEEAFKI